MRVHHLNCATLCPIGGAIATPDRKLVCHCLLIESDQGLILVDTGFGTADVRDPSKLEAAIRIFGRPRFSMEETALHQIRALGFDPADVRHIVPTHLDLDHASGLPDFPAATVHIFASEKDAALDPQTFIERRRYQRHHFTHGPKWQAYDVAGEPWFGFETVRGLVGLPPQILLIPLIGHTRGHCGVAVDLGERWLLHAGDAYFFRGEMKDRPSCPPGLRYFQALFAVDDRRRRQNQDRLRALAKDREDVELFSAHDSVELERYRAQRPSV